MRIDPQVDPAVVFPVLIALIAIFALLRWTRADGRLRWGIALLIGFGNIVFSLSRTPLF